MFGLPEGKFVDDHKFHLGEVFFHLQMGGGVLLWVFFLEFVIQDSSWFMMNVPFFNGVWWSHICWPSWKVYGHTRGPFTLGSDIPPVGPTMSHNLLKMIL